MKNADLFKDTFGTYATEIWSMPEKDFLKWLNEDAEPKTGHWINIGLEGKIVEQIVQSFTCSECGAISVFRMTGGKIVNGDLCPNCGAKIVEPQERSDKE